jgi:carbonic anhydrase/acetyltransferase-like protein (isoleucine patch superfamily)
MMESLILTIGERVPQVAPDAFVAPGAVILGSVTLESRASVWYNAVLRGDASTIVLGEDSNLQDGCVIHADPGFPVLIGKRVTIGHRAVIHGATIDDDVLIGMGAIVMNGAHIHSGSIVAAGALVSQGVEVPEGSLIAGVPGKVMRSATERDTAYIAHGSDHYVQLSREHLAALELDASRGD